LEDNVLIKSDGMPTYNFANVIDDRLMEISHVIRGIEYLSSTPKYNYLYRAFGWTPPRYIHLQPIMKDATTKLSKRHGDASFGDFIDKGYLPQAILNYIALLGWNPKDNREKFTLAELIDAFSLKGISKSPSVFDETKMRWLNSLYVKELPFDEYHRRALPWYELSCVKGGRFDYTLISRLLHGRTEIFSDIPRLLEFIDGFGGYDLSLYVNEKNKTDVAAARRLLPRVLNVLRGIEGNGWNNKNIFDNCAALAAELGVKSAALLWITRIALTGKQSTPGGATELAELFGKNLTLQRIEQSIERVNG
jgi:glutamyl-tRNA synthetase